MPNLPRKKSAVTYPNIRDRAYKNGQQGGNTPPFVMVKVMGNVLYNGATAEQLEYDYNPSRDVPNAMDIVTSYTTLSAQQYATAQNATLNIAYGKNPTQTYDFFAPTTAHNTGYLYVFIHGGFWQLLSKQDSAWMVLAFQNHGASVAVLDYTLCPHTTVNGIVTECQTAITHMVNNAKKLGFNPTKIIVAGHSAGGHLAMTMGMTNWTQYGIADPICGIVGISGVYDVIPIIYTSNNDALGLTEQTARDISPQHQTAIPTCPTIIAWGADETEQFKHQSQNYAQKINPTHTLKIQGKNHFDVVLDFGKNGTELMDRALGLMG